MLSHVDEMPIVHAGATHRVLVDPESEATDEMQRRFRGGAKTRDVPGVRRDLGLDQDDVQRGLEDARAEARSGRCLGHGTAGDEDGTRPRAIIRRANPDTP